MQQLKKPESAWFLLAIVTGVALLGWFELWGGARPTASSIFPLLGLLAWSIMWVHYVYGALRIRLDFPKAPALYGPLTYALVLALILLHPIIFILMRYQQTGLLPPASYSGYVGPENVGFVYLGVIALITFLGFEVARHFKVRARVRKYWHIISITQVVAMVFIYIHAIALGDIVTSPLAVWWATLGLIFIPCAYIVARYDWQYRERATS